MGALPGWGELEAAIPQVAATMRRYLAQVGCVLRLSSVASADLALRCFAAFLAQAEPEVVNRVRFLRCRCGGHAWSAAPGISPSTATSVRCLRRWDMRSALRADFAGLVG